MLKQPTIEKLQELKFNAMAEAWEQQQKDPEIPGLDFDERFGMLVDVEWLSRQNRSLERKLREAKLRLSQACIEDIDYQACRKLDKAVIHQLATCTWIADHHNVVITGATGVGKTFIACALAHQACRKGFRALYRRANGERVRDSGRRHHRARAGDRWRAAGGDPARRGAAADIERRCAGSRRFCALDSGGSLAPGRRWSLPLRSAGVG